MYHFTKIEVFIKDFFSKCDQIRSFLRIWSHLLKKSLMKNFIVLQCMLCLLGIGFTQKSTLQYHLERHSGELKYTCVDCSKKFVTRNDLTTHRKIHTQEKNNICKLCNMAFRKKSNYKRHMLKHSGERPHACKYCEKHFSRKEHLREHERIHTKEEPYVCQICDHRFKDAGNFSNHKKKHIWEELQLQQEVEPTAEPKTNEKNKCKENIPSVEDQAKVKQIKKENGIVIKVAEHPKFKNTANAEKELQIHQLQNEISEEKTTENKTVDIGIVTDRQLLSNEFVLSSPTIMSIYANGEGQLSDYLDIEQPELERYPLNSNSLKSNNFMTEYLYIDQNNTMSHEPSINPDMIQKSGLKLESNDKELLSLNRLHNLSDSAQSSKENSLFDMDLTSREVLDPNDFLTDEY